MIFFPSLVQVGETSLAKYGAIHWIGDAESLNKPIKEWLPLADTKTILLPSGDHLIEPVLPRAKNSLAGFGEPDKEAVHTWLFLR